MVEIIEIEDQLKIEPKGFIKFLAFKKPFTISKHNILKVYQDPKELSGWKGWRSPGTCIPFLFNAGTYYLKDKKNFWFVSNKSKAIIIDLKDEEFDKLIIEVENPEKSIQLLTSK